MKRCLHENIMIIKNGFKSSEKMTILDVFQVGKLDDILHIIVIGKLDELQAISYTKCIK